MSQGHIIAYVFETITDIIHGVKLALELGRIVSCQCVDEPYMSVRACVLIDMIAQCLLCFGNDKIGR